MIYLWKMGGISKGYNKFCNDCHDKQAKHIHHIDFDKTNNDTDNLKYLCVACHRLAHHNDYSDTHYDLVAELELNKRHFAKGHNLAFFDYLDDRQSTNDRNIIRYRYKE